LFYLRCGDKAGRMKKTRRNYLEAAARDAGLVQRQINRTLLQCKAKEDFAKHQYQLVTSGYDLLDAIGALADALRLIGVEERDLPDLKMLQSVSKNRFFSQTKSLRK
jgi:hypothetical protein